MGFRRWVAALIPLVVLAGCKTPTPYQPAGFGGGYVDKKIDANHYEVKFDGNGFATEQRVWTFWIYRCAELTKQSGYAYFVLTPPINKRERPVLAAPPRLGTTPSSTAPGTLPSSITVPSSKTAWDGSNGTARMNDGVFRPKDTPSITRVAHGGGGAPIFIPGGGGGTITTWHTDSIVAMFNDPLPLEAGTVFNAQTVLDAYAPYVQSGGKTVPEQRDALFARAHVNSPLAVAYLEFVGNLVARNNPGAIITSVNYVNLAKPVASHFPLGGEWTPVPDARHYISEESLVPGPTGEISYVVATVDGMGVSPLYRFDRVHVVCATHSGFKIAGGHVSLIDFSPFVTSVPLLADVGPTPAPFEGSDLQVADLACARAAQEGA